MTDEQFARLHSQVRALRAEMSRLAEGAPGEPAQAEALPALPPPDADGNYPAAEALDVLVARQVIRRRRAAGWSQIELARRGGVRPETVSRVETGKHAPNVATVASSIGPCARPASEAQVRKPTDLSFRPACPARVQYSARCGRNTG
jgi:DNA-binding XRE family transcriptional regulator